jgi:preprotein translocase subunit SecE
MNNAPDTVSAMAFNNVLVLMIGLRRQLKPSAPFSFAAQAGGSSKKVADFFRAASIRRPGQSVLVDQSPTCAEGRAKSILRGFPPPRERRNASTSMAKPTNPSGPVRPPMPKFKGGLKQYFKEVGVEMRRVIWPTRAETFRLTVMVLLVCVMFVLYLFAASTAVHYIITAMEGGKF